MNQIIFIPQTIHNPKFTSPWFFLHVYCGYLLQTYPRQIAEDLFYIATENLVTKQAIIFDNSIELVEEHLYKNRCYMPLRDINLEQVLMAIRGYESVSLVTGSKEKVTDINHELLTVIYGREVEKYLIKENKK